MFAPYRKILAYPGALAFSTAGVMARFPISMVTIALVLLISSVYGEYSIAGLTAAIYTISQSIGAPQISKLIDRHGQAKIMRPFLTVAMLGLTGMGIAAGLGAHPVWIYIAAAIAGGCVGSMGAMTRSRWNQVVTSPSELHTAYSWESVLDEFVFVAGPVLATFLATQISPLAAMGFAVLIAGTGGFWFLSQRATEPPVSKNGPSSPGTVLANSGMIVVALVFFCMGTIFGASDVSTIGYSEELGLTAYAGFVLASFAAGSLISALLYGTRSFVMPTWKQFVLGIWLLGAGSSLFIIIKGLPLLSGVMFITGFAIAPTIISGNNLVQQFVPRHRLTEGLAWTGTSIGLGFAAGSAIAGRIIDLLGARTGFYAVFAAAFIAAITALASAPVLRKHHLASLHDPA